MSGIEMLINPFADKRVSDESTRRSQNIQKVISSDDSLVREALELYSKDIYLVSLVLDPVQIDYVLQAIKSEYPQETVNRAETGHFISCLIDKSYKAGYNDFIITTGEFSIVGLPDKLRGTKERPLNYTLVGNTNSADILTHCHSTHKEGYLGNLCFMACHHCEINVYGDAGRGIGIRSYDSSFTFYNKVSEDCGKSAIGCTFTFHSRIGPDAGWDAKDSTFRAVEGVAYDTLLSSVQVRHNNTVQLIEPDGTVIDEVRK